MGKLSCPILICLCGFFRCPSEAVTEIRALPAEPGFKTPSMLMGADYVLGLPGVTLVG